MEVLLQFIFIDQHTHNPIIRQSRCLLYPLLKHIETLPIYHLQITRLQIQFPFCTLARSMQKINTSTNVKYHHRIRLLDDIRNLLNL